MADGEPAPLRVMGELGGEVLIAGLLGGVLDLGEVGHDVHPPFAEHHRPPPDPGEELPLVVEPEVGGREAQAGEGVEMDLLGGPAVADLAGGDLLEPRLAGGEQRQAVARSGQQRLRQQRGLLGRAVQAEEEGGAVDVALPLLRVALPGGVVPLALEMLRDRALQIVVAGGLERRRQAGGVEPVAAGGVRAAPAVVVLEGVDQGAVLVGAGGRGARPVAGEEKAVVDLSGSAVPEATVGPPLSAGTASAGSLGIGVAFNGREGVVPIRGSGAGGAAEWQPANDRPVRIATARDGRMRRMRISS